MEFESQQYHHPKLVLHFDVNETILCDDPAAGDSFEECLNKIICKSAFVKKVHGELPEVWLDGSPIDGEHPPPLCTTWVWPEGTVPYYHASDAARGQAKTFTEDGSPGAAYRPVFEKLKEALRWPNQKPGQDGEAALPDSRLCRDGHHFLIPAFFKTICELANRGRSFSIVIRTFGTDINDVAAALQAFSEGAHLSEFVPVVPEMSLMTSDHADGGEQTYTVWNGSYDRDTGTFRLHQQGGESIDNENDLVELLHAPQKNINCVACTDDYEWWKRHGYAPSAGKPVWLDYVERPYDILPIFFDDNIHNDSEDSIVAVRSKVIRVQQKDIYRAGAGKTNGGSPGAESSSSKGSSFHRAKIRKVQQRYLDQAEDGKTSGCSNNDSASSGSSNGSRFRPLSGAETLLEHGIHLVKVPTIEPILNPMWFIEQIDKCEQAWRQRLATATTRK
mmetsp:Transcript_29794/g.43934  ORF Transcript_29794/g.43934 Transcript_29794/m.43934 type:complete len:447 (+) Transcript_29794:124-1464(+)